MSVKVVDHPSRGRLPAAALLARGRDLLPHRLAPRHEDLLNALDDDLFARAEAARTDRAQRAFFDAMRLLRLEREPILTRFTEELDAPPEEERAAQARETPESAFEKRVDALALLADDALEERLAVTTRSQRVERDCELRLTLLRARIAHLLEQAPSPVACVPFEPRTVAGAFARAVTPLDLDPEVRLVVFKRFERAVLLEVADVYEDLDRLLRNAGVLPELTPAQALGAGPGASRPPPAEPPRPREEASAPAEATPAARTEASPDAVARPRLPVAEYATGRDAQDDAALRRAIETFEGLDAAHLTETLASLPGLRQRRRYAADPSDASAIVSSLLLDIAGAAQLRLAPMLAERSLDALPQRIDYGELLTRGAAKRGHAGAPLTQADEDLVNLVQALFDELLGDDNLPVPIRALLARLQFPILRIALTDSEFLGSEQHAARRFLNLITHTGIGWVRADERAQDRLYAVIENAVDEAARGDGSEYEALNARIEEAVVAEAELIRRASERVLEKERARLEAEKTRRLVERLVEHRCRLVPEGELRTFLGTDWQQVMYRAHQQEGPRSPASKRAFAALRSLSGAADLDGPALHRAIAEGLGRLGRDAETCSRDAARVIELMLDARAREVDAPAPGAPPPERQDAGIEKLPDRSAIAAASALSVNDWIEIRREGGQQIRCRLASVSEPPERCIFLNRRGVRMETLSRLEIAAAMQGGDIRRLDADQLFDTTLASVIGGLRTDAAAPVA